MLAGWGHSGGVPAVKHQRCKAATVDDEYVRGHQNHCIQGERVPSFALSCCLQALFGIYKYKVLLSAGVLSNCHLLSTHYHHWHIRTDPKLLSKAAFMHTMRCERQPDICARGVI